MLSFFIIKKIKVSEKKMEKLFFYALYLVCLIDSFHFLFVPGLRYPLHTCMFLQLSSFFYCFSSYSHFHLKYKSLSFFLGTSQKDDIFEVSATSTFFSFFLLIHHLNCLFRSTSFRR
jgi:hypothetical protein